MKKINLERSVEYSYWENLFMVLFFSFSVFIGLYFFESGETAGFFKILTGILFIVFLFFILLRKGFVANGSIYKGYFLFGILVFRKKIHNPGTDTFALIKFRNKQKYVRSYREPNWEYTVNSFELYFVKDQQKFNTPIIRLMKEENARKAITFLESNSNWKFKEIEAE